MKGRTFSQDVCEIIVRMLPLLDTSEIMAYTGASKTAIQQIARCYRLTGKPSKESQSGNHRGRARMMDLEDIEYMHGCLSRSCDTKSEGLDDGAAAATAAPTSGAELDPPGVVADEMPGFFGGMARGRGLAFGTISGLGGSCVLLGGCNRFFWRTATFAGCLCLVIAHLGRGLCHPSPTTECSRPGKMSVCEFGFYASDLK
ncbi:hypothetical protein DEU56DRAFT_761430 [Suillus clintonianus]|uniref:uncharacterized protein n=1 Tax=Suillus clintonianus TaxID=1904413 RepID=UPI001B876EA9|nr:uncharacterized protein DEU56DRAFT_761430 [Suillus clintonianus]KAG2116975.1 hypothetical protein DEU56DRAFT_761430 [Suillus clintonianus]